MEKTDAAATEATHSLHTHTHPAMIALTYHTSLAAAVAATTAATAPAENLKSKIK